MVLTEGVNRVFHKCVTPLIVIHMNETLLDPKIDPDQVCLLEVFVFCEYSHGRSNLMDRNCKGFCCLSRRCDNPFRTKCNVLFQEWNSEPCHEKGTRKSSCLDEGAISKDREQ